MGRSLPTALVVALIALCVLAVGAFAWDSSRSDRIAEGIKIGELDIGGLSDEEARSLVRERLSEPLTKPVTVKRGERSFTASPERLEIQGDVGAMVDDALEASGKGGLPGRLLRYATGGEVHETIEPRIAYSVEALDGFIGEVAQALNRGPINATIEPTPTSLNAVPARNGLALKEGELRERIEVALQSRVDRKVKAPVKRIEPEFTTKDIATRYPFYLTVDRTNFQLRLWKDLNLERTYTIAVGQVGYDTPAGIYHIQTKETDPTWYVPDSEWAGNLAGKVLPPEHPKNPIEARWMGFYNGAGIHGTSNVASLGSAASHGCIRMSIPEVTELYEQVGTGTPIYIGDS